MEDIQYQEIDNLIEEYEEDSRILRSDKMIMKNYPKVLVMSIASLFERQIKRRCQEFLEAPLYSITTTYPQISLLSYKNPNKPLVDKMFARLEGYNNTNGIEVLNADKFYDLFGGSTFKLDVEQYFEEGRIKKIAQITEMMNKLSPLLGKREQYDFYYVKQSDLKEKLQNCSFSIAERAYLDLKLRRNRVAHDYINGLSDTFEDICNFYYDAVIFVTALECSIKNLTVEDLDNNIY